MNAQRIVADRNRGQDETPVEDGCVVAFRDFSIAFWDADIGGWRGLQLTPGEFLRLQGLVHSFQEAHWVALNNGKEAA